jgi:hypothetical protein
MCLTSPRRPAAAIATRETLAKGQWRLRKKLLSLASLTCDATTALLSWRHMLENGIPSHARKRAIK